MNILRGLPAAAAGVAFIVLGTIHADKATAFTIEYDASSSDLSGGQYNYNFKLDETVEVVTLSGIDLPATTIPPKPLVNKDFLSLTGMSGVTDNSTSDVAADIYEKIGSTSTSASWGVKALLGATAQVKKVPATGKVFGTGDDLSLGTFTVTAPGTRLGEINYAADYTALAGVSLPNLQLSSCSSLVNGTCTGTTQGPVVVPEPSSGLGVLALGAFGAGLMLKRKLKKQTSIKVDTKIS